MPLEKPSRPDSRSQAGRVRHREATAIRKTTRSSRCTRTHSRRLSDSRPVARDAAKVGWCWVRVRPTARLDDNDSSTSARASAAVAASTASTQSQHPEKGEAANTGAVWERAKTAAPCGSDDRRSPHSELSPCTPAAIREFPDVSEPYTGCSERCATRRPTVTRGRGHDASDTTTS
jgi:hypothetical protein